MFQVKHLGSIAVVGLDRPPVNAMNDEWIERFNALLDTLLGNADCSVVLFRSNLKLFSAGADLAQLRARFDDPSHLQAEVGRRYQNLFARIETLPKATIAEIGGAAYGGGLELALSCDFRFAAINSKLGFPEIGLGLIPGAGGTQRLTSLCGRANTSRMILATETIDGNEAARIGLVQWAVPAESLAEAAMDYAKRLAALPAHAIAAAKSCIAAAIQASQVGFNLEVEQVRSLLDDERTRMLVRAFLSK
jgi:enoyl-CoA hydratase